MSKYDLRKNIGRKYQHVMNIKLDPRILSIGPTSKKKIVLDHKEVRYLERISTVLFSSLLNIKHAKFDLTLRKSRGFLRVDKL